MGTHEHHPHPFLSNKNSLLATSEVTVYKKYTLEHEYKNLMKQNKELHLPWEQQVDDPWSRQTFQLQFWSMRYYSLPFSDFCWENAMALRKRPWHFRKRVCCHSMLCCSRFNTICILIDLCSHVLPLLSLVMTFKGDCHCYLFPYCLVREYLFLVLHIIMDCQVVLWRKIFGTKLLCIT